MYKIAFSLVVALTPAALGAQATAQAEAQSQTRAGAQVGASSAQVSAATSAEAEIAVARKRGLPTQPIRRRVAEGRAKGASEAQLAVAAARVRANLEAAHEAMVSAGRRPSDEETEQGGWVIERGYTRAQVAAVAKSAPSERSLVVAFDVLTRLVARGVASENALAQVRSRLEARATDAQISALVGASASANGTLGVGRATTGAAASGNAAVGAGASGTRGAASATGAVSGVVGGVLGKP